MILIWFWYDAVFIISYRLIYMRIISFSHIKVLGVDIVFCGLYFLTLMKSHYLCFIKRNLHNFLGCPHAATSQMLNRIFFIVVSLILESIIFNEFSENHSFKDMQIHGWQITLSIYMFLLLHLNEHWIFASQQP